MKKIDKCIIFIFFYSLLLINRLVCEQFLVKAASEEKCKIIFEGFLRIEHTAGKYSQDCEELLKSLFKVIHPSLKENDSFKKNIQYILEEHNKKKIIFTKEQIHKIDAFFEKKIFFNEFATCCKENNNFSAIQVNNSQRLFFLLALDLIVFLLLDKKNLLPLLHPIINNLKKGLGCSMLALVSIHSLWLLFRQLQLKKFIERNKLINE